MSEIRESFRHARADHYLHWAAMIAVSAYQWQLQGAIVGISLLIGLILAISLTNHFILGRWGSLKAMRWSRWAWVILALIIVAASNAEIGTVK